MSEVICKSNWIVLSFRQLMFSLLISCCAIIFTATAASLPKGNCSAPKPYTDLRHCKYRGADLTNLNLAGVDLRGAELYKTKFHGANLKNALVDGAEITNAFLDGVIGLPAEALGILRTSYLATSNDKDGLVLSALPTNYKGGNENVAGLDNIFLTQKISGTQSTIALLSYPKHGDAQNAGIFARFDNDKFDFPVCYQSIKPFDDGQDYYWGKWSSLKIRHLKNGNYLLGALAKGADGDDSGMSEWSKVVLLEMSPSCKLTVLHEEYLSRGGNAVKRNGKYVTEWCGGSLDYRFVDGETVEIKTITSASSKAICGANAQAKGKVMTKKIKLHSEQF
jgi:Pentapeptide repeats (8 copies)